MKVVLFDKNIIVRIVSGSESDFEYHRDRGEGLTLENTFSGSVGQYIVTDGIEHPYRDSTKLDLCERHGSQTVIPNGLLKPILSSIDLSNETEEFNTWYDSLGDVDIDLTQDSCLIYSLSEPVKKVVKQAFGIIEVQDIVDRNPQYAYVAPTTTTTTTAAPAE